MMQQARPVRIIQPTISIKELTALQEDVKRITSAYARVSTNHEEQLESYDAQVTHYTQFIKSNPQWEFGCIYADEGISGTSTKKRNGFNQMVEDALAGKFNLLITKSISRFARNTVDSLVTMRKLKEAGVEIYFEKENIYTFDSRGEVMLTIMASLAQDESRSISENVTWGKRKRMADGKFSLPYKRFLGYRKGEDGLPEIVEEEAAIIRLIYGLFIEGKTPSNIAKQLVEQGIPTPGGKTNWRPNTVESILTNEKYKGEAILQKKFTVDFLTKQTKVNEGEVPQYYIENSHPAIITPEVFDIVQHEMKKRRASGRQTNCAHCFSGKIVCGICGRSYGSRVWSAGTKYRRRVWQCLNRTVKGTPCKSPHVNEDTLEQEFIEAVNSIIMNKAEIMEGFEGVIRVLTDTAALEADIAATREERDMYLLIAHESVEKNARVAQNQDEFRKQHTAHLAKYEASAKRLANLEASLADCLIKRERINGFLEILRKQHELVTAFDEAMWYALVEQVVVESSDKLKFIFKNGMEKTVGI